MKKAYCKFMSIFVLLNLHFEVSFAEAENACASGTDAFTSGREWPDLWKFVQILPDLVTLNAGANDIVVVVQPDGKLASTAIDVHVGKLRSRTSLSLHF